MKENDRTISVVAKEISDDLNGRFSIAIPPGGFGENVLVEKGFPTRQWGIAALSVSLKRKESPAGRPGSIEESRRR